MKRVSAVVWLLAEYIQAGFALQQSRSRSHRRIGARASLPLALQVSPLPRRAFSTGKARHWPGSVTS
jgi:hypothetical protein